MAMPLTEKSIVLVSEDPEFAARMSALLKDAPGVALTRCDTTLLGLNGKASELARQSELVIFKAEADPDHDVAALRDIARSGASARLLAVSDSGVSLGAAHSLLRAGVTEVVPDTLDDAEFGRVVARLSMSRRLTLAMPERREGQLIAVSKARGGIGATTFAVNLADALCRQKGRFGRSLGPQRKVALLDLDLQFGAVATFLDLAPNDALYNLARDHMIPDAVFLDQSVETAANGLAVLAAPSRFLPMNAISVEQVRALIHVLRQAYDFVVVDLPQVMVDWISPVLEAASRVCVVTGTTVPFIQQSRRLIDFFREQNPGASIEVVIGKQKRPLLRPRRQAESEKALDLPFRHWLPPDDRAAGEAMDQGRPLSQVAPGSALTKSIRSIAVEVAKPAHGAAANVAAQTV